VETIIIARETMEVTTNGVAGPIECPFGPWCPMGQMGLLGPIGPYEPVGPMGPMGPWAPWAHGAHRAGRPRPAPAGWPAGRVPFLFFRFVRRRARLNRTLRSVTVLHPINYLSSKLCNQYLFWFNGALCIVCMLAFVCMFNAACIMLASDG